MEGVGGFGKGKGGGEAGRGSRKRLPPPGKQLSQGTARWLVPISIPMHNKSLIHCHANEFR